jgi:hypothetical protein
MEVSMEETIQVSLKQMRRACYRCKHRRAVPGDCHSACGNLTAHVIGDAHGKFNGWFSWPFNFDPVWLLSCTGFESVAVESA